MSLVPLHIDAPPKGSLVRANADAIRVSPDEAVLVVIEGEALGKQVMIGNAPFQSA